MRPRRAPWLAALAAVAAAAGFLLPAAAASLSLEAAPLTPLSHDGAPDPVDDGLTLLSVTTTNGTGNQEGRMDPGDTITFVFNTDSLSGVSTSNRTVTAARISNQNHNTVVTIPDIATLEFGAEYQGAQTAAFNDSTVAVDAGTSTTTVTVTLGSCPTGGQSGSPGCNTGGSGRLTVTSDQSFVATIDEDIEDADGNSVTSPYQSDPDVQF